MGAAGRTLLTRGWGWDSLLCPVWGGGGGRKGGGAEGAGGFPQRGLNVLKYSAYKRGQEFPAQTAREEETARPSCRPWHPPPGVFNAEKVQALGRRRLTQILSPPPQEQGPPPGQRDRSLVGAGCQLGGCPGIQTRPVTPTPRGFLQDWGQR